MKKQIFTVLIEKDENGTYVAEVPDLKGCYTQGDSVEEVMKNIKEVIEMCLEEQSVIPNEFIGIQKIEV
ncbi:type II toxin-antitoxin system HicB family antitoxin [Candidatus Woesearchaeota archaeon]|nr:type II toxin-antitoxin system HicB family antitoxin [Candidatus Woesearchaeota archaeon]